MTFCPEMKAGTLILCSLLGDFLYNGKGFLTSNLSRQTSRIISTNSSAKSIACCWSFLFIGIPWPSPTAWTMLGFNLYFGRGYRKCTSSGGFLPSRSDTMKRWTPSPERFLISTRQPTSHCSTSSKSAPSLILRSQNSWNLSPSSTSVKENSSSNSASVDDVEHLSGFMTLLKKMCEGWGHTGHTGHQPVPQSCGWSNAPIHLLPRGEKESYGGIIIPVVGQETATCWNA